MSEHEHGGQGGAWPGTGSVNEHNAQGGGAEGSWEEPQDESPGRKRKRQKKRAEAAARAAAAAAAHAAEHGEEHEHAPAGEAVAARMSFFKRTVLLGGLKTETRAGVAILLSFAILIGVLVTNHNRKRAAAAGAKRSGAEVASAGSGGKGSKPESAASGEREPAAEPAPPPLASIPAPPRNDAAAAPASAQLDATGPPSGDNDTPPPPTQVAANDNRTQPEGLSDLNAPPPVPPGRLRERQDEPQSASNDTAAPPPATTAGLPAALERSPIVGAAPEPARTGNQAERSEEIVGNELPRLPAGATSTQKNDAPLGAPPAFESSRNRVFPEPTSSPAATAAANSPASPSQVLGAESPERDSASSASASNATPPPSLAIGRNDEPPPPRTLPPDFAKNASSRMTGAGDDWQPLPNDGKKKPPGGLPSERLVAAGSGVTSAATVSASASGRSSRPVVVSEAVGTNTKSDGLEPITHVVQRGENFWTISRLYYGSGRYYRALWSANSDRVPEITQLYVNQTVRVPPFETLDPSLFEAPTQAPARSGFTAVPKRNATTASTGSSRSGKSGSAVELALPVGANDGDSGRGPEPDAADTRGLSRLDAGYPTYSIRPHDTLRSIARDTLGDSRRADEILSLNRDNIRDPKSLPAGLQIVLPDDAQLGKVKR